MSADRKKWLRRFIPLLLLLGVASWAEGKIVFIASKSVAPTVAYRSTLPPQKGDYVNFQFSHEFIGGGTHTLTKRYRCGPGDTLRTENLMFYCNNEFLGQAKAQRRDGTPFSHFVWNGAIPPGKAFLWGEHPDSFDSRYWGFMDIKQLERVVPIL